MVSSREIFGRLWFIVATMLVAANLILLSLHLSTADALSATTIIDTEKVSQSTNVLSANLAVASKELKGSIDDTNRFISSSVHSATTGTSRITKSAGTTLKNSAGSASRGVASGVASVVSGTGSVVKTASSVASVDSLIKSPDNTQIPVIIPTATTTPVQSTQPAPTTGSAAQWPVPGDVTTSFGVPHFPYQPIHTGLDISDGKSPGVTPVTPFKAGQVAEVVRSNRGLGNYVVVDHGGGVTSVYGHLHSIAVQKGQQINQSTILGYEGSTGASTGTHLHFEVRINGQPVDPRKFISGHP